VTVCQDFGAMYEITSGGSNNNRDLIGKIVILPNRMNGNTSMFSSTVTGFKPSLLLYKKQASNHLYYF